MFGGGHPSVALMPCAPLALSFQGGSRKQVREISGGAERIGEMG